MTVWLRLTLACWAALAAPGAAGAATPVRSGEHATFTRLVFPARAGLAWTVERGESDSVTLTFDDPSLDLDGRDIFARIPRSRIANAEADGPVLALDLACACDLRVSQIPTGHVVIDVAARPEGATTPAPDTAPIPAAAPERGGALALPLRLPPVEMPGLRLPTVPTRPAPAEAAPAPASEPRTERGTQIAIRGATRPTLTPGGASAPVPAGLRGVCAEESRAARLLRRDPVAALAEIPTLRARLIDEADAPVAEAYEDLAEAYLAAGFGAEARHVLRVAPTPPDPVLLKIGAALDGMPEIAETSMRPNSDCGPASTLLALLAGLPPEDWARADADALARFVDVLPRAARADLVPRLRPALARLGRPDLLDIDPHATETPAPAHPVAAGTDADAIAATIAALESAAGPVDTDALANGLALRASVPDGPLREALDRALAHRLVLTGHLAEAVDVIGTRTSLAEAALSAAANILPPEDVAVVAMRLRPVLGRDGPAAEHAAAALGAFGLDGLSRRFRPSVPVEAAPDAAFATATPDEKAWLSRTFAQLDPQTPRGRVAELLQQRNAGPVPADDFARAASAATGSARLSDAVTALIGPAD